MKTKINNASGRQNSLFRWLLLGSFIIHLFLLGYIAGIYNSRQMTYLELALRDISRPFARTIPRPRFRPEKPPEPVEAQTPKVPKPVPAFKPLKLDPADSDLPDSLVENLAMPEIPGVPGGYGSLPAQAVEYSSPRDYLEMVKITIERHKDYPFQARSRRIEGRATVRFVILADGSVEDVVILKTSRHQVLDRAALKAVEEAAPFHRPPPRFFTGAVPVQLTIVFELTV